MKGLAKGIIFSFLLIFSCSTPLIVSCATSHRNTRKQLKRGVYHKVRKGQTLWRIAKTYGRSVEVLQRINKIKDPTDIKVGDLIFIPKVKRIRKVRVISPATVATKKHTTKKKRATSRSRKKKKKTVKPSFIWPAKGKITSRFGWRKKGQRHDGIDIAAKKGAPIYAAQSGKVIYADNRLRYYGNTIILKHSGGFFTVYAHNKKNLVTLGKWVKRGTKIAEVGDSGRASRSHLHFEVRKKDKSVNPLNYLPR